MRACLHWANSEAKDGEEHPSVGALLCYEVKMFQFSNLSEKAQTLKRETLPSGN